MVQSYIYKHCSHDTASLNFFDVMGYVTKRPKQEYVCRRFKCSGSKTGCELSKICYLCTHCNITTGNNRYLYFPCIWIFKSKLKLDVWTVLTVANQTYTQRVYANGSSIKGIPYNTQRMNLIFLFCFCFCHFFLIFKCI